MHICWFHVISRYLQSTTHSVSLQNATKHSNVSSWQCFWCVSSRIRPSFNPCHKNQKLLGGKWSCNRDHTDPPISIQGTLPLEFCRDKAATEQSSFQLKPWRGFELSMLDGCTSELSSWKWSFDRSSCVENHVPRFRSMDSDITICRAVVPKKTRLCFKKKNANPTEPRDLLGVSSSSTSPSTFKGLGPSSPASWLSWKAPGPSESLNSSCPSWVVSPIESPLRSNGRL